MSHFVGPVQGAPTLTHNVPHPPTTLTVNHILPLSSPSPSIPSSPHSLCISFKYIIVVVRRLLGNSFLRPLNNYHLTELLAPSRTQHQSTSSDTSQPYVAANLTWGDLETFQLGDNRLYGAFNNTPLVAGAVYDTTLFGERFDGMKVAFTPQTFGESNMFTMCTLHPPSHLYPSQPAPLCPLPPPVPTCSPSPTCPHLFPSPTCSPHLSPHLSCFP